MGRMVGIGWKMTEFDELVKNGTASAVYKRYTHVSGGMLIDEEFEELKREVIVTGKQIGRAHV